MLEERDVQIRGFTVRLALDVCMVFSANPEDYTNRGRIVTPLKDRIGSVVRTHYPLTRELGIQITDANAWSARDDGPKVVVPMFLKEIVEETSRLARKSPHVNQASGVSVRMSIANSENLVSNAERRALAMGEQETVARVSDLAGLVGSSRGKIELQMTEETGEEDKLLGRIIEEAVKTIFDQHFDPKQFRNIVEYFESGNTLEVGDRVPHAQILKRIEAVREFRKQVERAAGELDAKLAAGPLRPQLEASIAEFILDGLYTPQPPQQEAKERRSDLRPVSRVRRLKEPSTCQLLSLLEQCFRQRAHYTSELVANLLVQPPHAVHPTVGVVGAVDVELFDLRMRQDEESLFANRLHAFFGRVLGRHGRQFQVVDVRIVDREHVRGDAHRAQARDANPRVVMLNRQPFGEGDGGMLGDRVRG